MAYPPQQEASPPPPPPPLAYRSQQYLQTTTTLHFKHGETRQVHDFVLAKLAPPPLLGPGHDGTTWGSAGRDVFVAGHHVLDISMSAGDVLLHYLYTGSLEIPIPIPITPTPAPPAPPPPPLLPAPHDPTIAAAAAAVELAIVLELIAFSASHHQHLPGLDPLLHARAAHLARQKDLDPAAVLELVQRTLGRGGDVSGIDWLRDYVRAAPATDLHDFIRRQMTVEDCGSGSGGGGGGGLAGSRGPVLSARELVLCTLVTAEMQHAREAQDKAAKLRGFADEVRKLVKDWEVKGNGEGRLHPLCL